MTLYKIFRQFARNTTLHGAPHIIYAKMWHVRFFWIAIFFGTLVMFGIQIVFLLMKYLRYEKRTVVEMTQQDKSTHPWITVCRRRSLDVITLQQIYYLFQHNESERQNIVTKIDNQFVRSFNSFYDNVIVKTEQLIDEYDLYPHIINSLNATFLHHGITKYDDIFVASESKGHQLIKSTFLNGLCFTLKFQGESDLNGPVASMALIDDHQLLPGEEERRKVPYIIDKIFGDFVEQSIPRVYIHPPNTHPLTINSLQFSEVHQQRVTTFYINAAIMERLDVPYGKCASNYPFEPHPSGVYSDATCKEWCLSKKIIFSCGCKYHPLLHLNTENQEDSIPLCLSLGIYEGHVDLNVSVLQQRLVDELKCLASINQWQKECYQNCPKVCNEIFFFSIITKTISFSPQMLANLVPSYMNSLKVRNNTARLKLVENKLKKNADGSFRFNNLVEDFSYINFVLKNEVTIMTEFPDYYLCQLLSDIGGQIGLWIGMSVITIFELLSLILDLATNACNIRKSSKRRCSYCENININNVESIHFSTCDVTKLKLDSSSSKEAH